MIDKLFSRRARRYIFIAVIFLAFTALVFAFGSQQPNMADLGTVEKEAIRAAEIVEQAPLADLEPQRENATFVTLCREGDLAKAMLAVQSWEDRFNKKFHYNWVFLNDKEFSSEFKDSISNLASGSVQFGLVPEEIWSVPKHIDTKRMQTALAEFKKNKVHYGDSIPYRKMCRFHSGLFYDHELLKPYKYYWRVDPDTAMYCDIDYDVFKFMREHKKQYGFVLSFREFKQTVPTLMKSAYKFFEANPQYVHPNNGLDFVKFTEHQSYAMCHFWSNFEIGDMDFYRSEAYRKFFHSLDQDGGFFYERWGDAPVHSIAVAGLLDKKAVHFFDDIGYKHGAYYHTPENSINRGLKCSLREKDSVDWVQFSCLRKANEAFQLGLVDPDTMVR